MERTTNISGQITRTQETTDRYRHRVTGMIKQAIKDRFVNNKANPDAIDLSKWLISKKNIYCASTFRQYRAALIMWMEECNFRNSVNAIDLLNADNSIKHFKRSMSNNTSAMKDKKLSDPDREEIINWLRNNPTQYSVPLILYLRIGTSLGLRPCEWKSARVDIHDDGSAELHVVNAKATNGRSNGIARTLMLGDLPHGMIELIHNFIELIRRLNDIGKWDNFYHGCRKTLYHAARKLWPNRKKYPTLYSLRHQFCANAKSSGMTKMEVAALMGHASDETAGIHYGKKRVGSGLCPVKPSISDVERLSAKSKYSQSTNEGENNEIRF